MALQPVNSGVCGSRDSLEQNCPPPGNHLAIAVTQPLARQNNYMSVENSLRECAGIPVRDFALIAVLDSGEEQVYTSNALKPLRDKIYHDFASQIFAYTGGESSWDKEFELMRNSDNTGGSSRKRSRCQNGRYQIHKHCEGSGRGATKRRRAWQKDQNVPTAVTVFKMEKLVVGNSDEVKKFYATRFRDMQQASCKIMSQAFVKLLEPKKQSNHPYIKGDEMAPHWWPLGSGENYVRHREPDHLLKAERVNLLVHILRMLIEPVQSQHPSIQKLGLDVKKLEDVTNEALSNWLADKDHPENAAKKPIMVEIFKVALTEETYKAGSIDATTQIPVICREGAMVDSDVTANGKKRHNGTQGLPLNISTSIASPKNMDSPTIVLQSHTDLEPASMFQYDRAQFLPYDHLSHGYMDEHGLNVLDGFSSCENPDFMCHGCDEHFYHSASLPYTWC